MRVAASLPRRAVLTALCGAPVAVATGAFAQLSLAKAPDPTWAAIEAFRAADIAFCAAPEDDEALCDARAEALLNLAGTRPTTREGARAIYDVVLKDEEPFLDSASPMLVLLQTLIEAWQPVEAQA